MCTKLEHLPLGKKFRLDYSIAKMCSDIQKTCTVNMNFNRHFLVPRTNRAIWGQRDSLIQEP